MTLSRLHQAMWANRIQRDCLKMADGDVDAALLAAEVFLGSQPMPTVEELMAALSTEDDLGNLHSDTSGEFVAKGAGEGRGHIEKVHKGKVSGRAKAFLEEASKIKVTDKKVGSGIGRRDYDDIENAMTREEHIDFDNAMSEAEMSARDSMMEDYEPQISEREVAEENGMSARDIRNKIIDLLGNRYPNLSAFEDRRGNYGTNGVDFIARIIRGREDIEESIKETMLNDLDELRDEIEKDMQDAMEAAEEGERENAMENMDIDTSEERIEYLRNFYDENEERFSGSGDIDDNTWGQDSDGNGVLLFKTGLGNEYKIRAVNTRMIGQEAVEISFSDSRGSYSITNSAAKLAGMTKEEQMATLKESMEVFSKVVPAVIAYIKNKNAPLIYFSAAEPSRQRLYERLVKTVTVTMPDFFAASVRSKSFFVGKTSIKQELLEYYQRSVSQGGANATVLVEGNA